MVFVATTFVICVIIFILCVQSFITGTVIYQNLSILQVRDIFSHEYIVVHSIDHK
jgi:hypothetical protein